MAGATVLLHSDRVPGAKEPEPEKQRQGLHRLQWKHGEMPRPVFGSPPVPFAVGARHLSRQTGLARAVPPEETRPALSVKAHLRQSASGLALSVPAPAPAAEVGGGGAMTSPLPADPLPVPAFGAAGVTPPQTPGLVPVAPGQEPVTGAARDALSQGQPAPVLAVPVDPSGPDLASTPAPDQLAPAPPQLAVSSPATTAGPGSEPARLLAAAPAADAPALQSAFPPALPPVGIAEGSVAARVNPAGLARAPVASEMPPGPAQAGGTALVSAASTPVNPAGIATLPPPQPQLTAKPALALAPRPEPAQTVAPPASASPPQADQPPVRVVAERPLPKPAFPSGALQQDGFARLVGAARPQASAQAPQPQTARIAPAATTRTFPVSDRVPLFSYDDELILEVKVAGYPGGDTIVAYGTFDQVYLPLGTLARILDLSITVSDDGNYASGWFLDEKRTLSIDLRQHRAQGPQGEVPLELADAAAFDGDLYLRADRFSQFLPLKLTADLRGQTVRIETLEPFPFEERLKREAAREKIASRAKAREAPHWPREETPWLGLSVPAGDVEVRAMSDSTHGERLEGDLRLAGDFAFMSAQAFLGVSSKHGLTDAHVELGRRDPDSDLLGPLRATEFRLGDVSTLSMPFGLRGVSGRGGVIANTPVESLSVFETVDLRGNLPDGYDVELYRNGVLIDSTRTPVNGRYEFTQVSLEYGLNVFRLVFHGPQGQKYEEVRRFSVGDGRLPKGKLVYQFGLAQKDVNLLGVRGPEFSPGLDYGRWRATGQLAYGLTSGITASLSGAWFESAGGKRWMGMAGLRTGIAGFALKADLAMSDHGAKAAEVGVGGKILGTSFTLTHAEYSGRFVDETRSLAGDPLRRATEIDANTTISLGGGEGTVIPLSARLRRFEFRNGRSQIDANLRGSIRMLGAVLSNTIDYSRTSTPGFGSFSQLAGNFDLATLNRSKTQARLSLGYAVMPDPELTSASVEVAHAFNPRTLVNGSIGYGFKDKDTQLGLSAIRQFDRFTIAAEAKYGIRNRTHSFALRLGTSFGRNPMTGRFFLAEPGQAYSGSATVRAFQDMDGNGRYGSGDLLLPDVEFSSSGRTARTDAEGSAMLVGLGSGNRASIQVDPSTLPDIFLAPVTRGVEIVPRPGRTHTTDFPIVGLSDIEGTVYFAKSGQSRGVGGVRLRLVRPGDETPRFVKTEVDGYYFFEQVPPGEYTLVVDPEQAARLGICLQSADKVVVGPRPDRISRDLNLQQCGP